MLLTKSQKNYIFYIIAEVNKLNPSEFEFRIDSNNNVNFTHIPSKYFVEFLDPSSTTYNYYIILSPGPNKHTETLYHSDWEDVIVSLSEWAESLKKEIEEPDLWQSYIKVDTKLKFEEKENLPFTVNEHEILIDNLRLLERRIIKEFVVNSTQQSELKSAIEKLKQNSKSFGKKDWFTFFLGTLQGIAINLALDPSKVEKLANLVKKIFSNILKLTGG